MKKAGEQMDIFDVPGTVFQTVPLTNRELFEKKLKVTSQNYKVLELFKTYKQTELRKFTAWDVNRLLNLPEKRITSTRRAITTLMNHGFLQKLAETKVEQEGMKNHFYKLV